MEELFTEARAFLEDFVPSEGGAGNSSLKGQSLDSSFSLLNETDCLSLGLASNLFIVFEVVPFPFLAQWTFMDNSSPVLSLMSLS